MRIHLIFTVLWVFSFCDPAVLADSVHLATVATGFERPVAIDAPDDSSGRLFVVEQQGLIRIVQNGSVTPAPLLDIRSQVDCCNERGLLGMAFHPDYTQNGFLFVNYTNNQGDTVIARWQVSEDANLADPSSQVILMTLEQPLANHNGGHLAFGPDGYLYIGTGDGGGAGDPFNNGQDPLSLLGKMLRIDVDGDPPYRIPPDNPFAGTDFVLDEIWAAGLRNPYRYSFDRITGDLYIADVGQDQREEVNVLRTGSATGLNYGWRLMEGSLCFNPGNNCNDGTLTLPDFEYAHQSGRCSITGGYVYRGNRIQHLGGSYLYADFCSGEIIAATQTADAWVQTVLLDTAMRITTFGQDPSGELYVADLGGNLMRLVSPLSIAPASGTYLSSSMIDLSIIVRGRPEVANTDISVTLNGQDISAIVAGCVMTEPLLDSGTGFTCAGIPLTVLEPGIYTVTAALNGQDNDPVSAEVVWEILETQQ